MLKKNIKFLIFYFLFWYLIFFTGKLFFLLYHFRKTSELGFQTITGIFYYGLKLDFSAIGYLLVIPVFFLLISALLKKRFEYFLVRWYTVLTVTVAVFLILIDIELYRHWGFRLDKTPLNYINNPADMMASMQWFSVFLGLLFTLIISSAFIYLYNKKIGSLLREKTERSFGSFIFFLFCFPALFITIRGGFDTSPVNHSSAYFSNKTFANHAALNVLWNLGYSLSENESNDKYIFFSDEEAKKKVNELITETYSVSEKLISSRPNILLIILESFTAKAIEPLGGLKDVTPGLNQLSQTGIFFKNFYAIGDRSDKGICSIISGFPAFSSTSILKYPDKFSKLPSISQMLLEKGYKTSFYYGGDLNFFNFKGFFLSSGFKNLISKSDFPSKEVVSKWGVPDEFLFERLYNDLTSSTDTPFFNAIFTLSSHQPFDIPSEHHFKKNDDNSKFLSSVYYTDSCLFTFINRLKKNKIWENTLVIIMADHGSVFPDNLSNEIEKNYHIPLLWTGGAVKKDTVILKYGYQPDLPKTLLNQLGITSNEFIYGKDLLNRESKGFSYFATSDGIGFKNDSVNIFYDVKSDKVNIDTANFYLKQAKSLLQVSYADFLLK